jgi:DNA-binding LacI/PurR family transcriptional regulator
VAARRYESGLTTIRQPLVDKGRAAGRMLPEAIEGGTPADVALPTELVVRGSTAPPATR